MNILNKPQHRDCMKMWKILCSWNWNRQWHCHLIYIASHQTTVWFMCKNSTGSACSTCTAGWFCCSSPKTVVVQLPLAPAQISPPGMLLGPATTVPLPLEAADKMLLPFKDILRVGLILFNIWCMTVYLSAGACNCAIGNTIAICTATS